MSGIYEAKASGDFSAFGTFRPLGTSAIFWRNLANKTTVYAEFPGEEYTGQIDIFDNPELDGEPVTNVPASVVRGW